MTIVLKSQTGSGRVNLLQAGWVEAENTNGCGQGKDPGGGGQGGAPELMEDSSRRDGVPGAPESDHDRAFDLDE